MAGRRSDRDPDRARRSSAGPRARATARRRRAILDAALGCFSTLGYEKTTMADIRARAGASTGSIYHHFKSKEQLAAALYLEGIRQSQGAALRALQGRRSAEEGIRALVASYLEWVEQSPELAAFLLSMRRAEFVESAAGELERMNREFTAEVQEWMDPHIAEGTLPALRPDLYLSLLTGPSDHFARRWLRHRTRTDLRSAARRLADAAWLALHGLAESDRARDRP